jgi:MFS family permease
VKGREPGANAMRLRFFYGWIIIAVTFVTMAIGVNARTSFSLFFPPIIDEFGWEGGVTAGAFSFGFLVSAAVSPLIGRNIDRFGPRTVMELGVALMAAGLLLAPLTAGQILLGHLSDRVGREWIWSASCLGFAISFASLIALAHSQTLLLVYVMVLTQGMLGYGLTSIMGAVVAEIFQGKHYGSIFGAIMFVALAGGAAGPWVTGVLHDLSGNYTSAFVIGIGVSVLSAIAIWQASPGKIRAVAGQLHKVQSAGTGQWGISALLSSGR